MAADGESAAIDGIELYYLKPGFLYVTKNPSVITTVLGSCVSVCFFSYDLTCGGMNHFVFPEWSDGKNRSTHYGDLNLAECMRIFRSMGYGPEKLHARIVGGSWIKNNSASQIIADMNVDKARSFCTAHGIGIVSQDTGGTTGRHVRFRTDSGELAVSFIIEADHTLFYIPE